MTNCIQSVKIILIILWVIEAFVMSRKNLRSRLFWLFILIGALPLLIVLIVTGFIRVKQLEEDAKNDMWMKTTVIDNYVTDRLERNFQVLHATVVNPILQQYVASRDKLQEPLALQIMNDTNLIFKDDNMMALTGGDGQQLLRTDNEPLVNVTKREHFRQSMLGRDYVSNLINSMSTGKDIVVLEVPVKDNNYQVIGMLQRNFVTTEMQDFVSSITDEKISIIMVDRDGNILAYTNKGLFGKDKKNLPVPYQIVSQTMSGVFGVVRGEVNGVDSLIGYKRNSLTNWPIIIIYPYKYIFETVNIEIAKMATIGTLCLLLISFMAFRFSKKAAKPIQEVLSSAKNVSDDVKMENVSVASNDEVEELAEVLNEMRSERDLYKQEAERDTLTNLYTKDTIEALFNKKVKQRGNIEKAFDYIVFYLIELDNFKDLNKKMGHLYGDRVLLDFAQKLKKCFRPLDCVGRLEGNEFIVIADQISDTTDILRKAKHINKVARTLVLDDNPVEITASIGIALFPQDGYSYNTVLNVARDALSKAKLEGRDRYYTKF